MYSQNISLPSCKIKGILINIQQNVAETRKNYYTTLKSKVFRAFSFQKETF